MNLRHAYYGLYIVAYAPEINPAIRSQAFAFFWEIETPMGRKCQADSDFLL